MGRDERVRVGGDRVVSVRRLLGADVERRSVDRAVLEGATQGVFVYDRPARSVEQVAVECRQLCLADQPACRVGQGNVDGHEVRTLEERVVADQFDARGLDLGAVVTRVDVVVGRARDRRVTPQHLGAKAVGQEPRDAKPDLAETENTDRSLAHLAERRAALVPLAGSGADENARPVPEDPHRGTRDVLDDAGRDRLGIVRDDHTAGRRGREVDVVGARAVDRDDLEIAGVEQVGSDQSRATEERLGVRDGRRKRPVGRDRHPSGREFDRDDVEVGRKGRTDAVDQNGVRVAVCDDDTCHPTTVFRRPTKPYRHNGFADPPSAIDMVDFDYPIETWGLAVFGTLAALIATALPVVAFVRIVPGLKEALIGAAAVYLLLDTADAGNGAAFAVVAGMAATLLFNALAVVFGAAFGVSLVGGGAAAVSEVGAGAGIDLPVLLRFARLFSVLVVSPIGYAAGGGLGAYLVGRNAEPGDDPEESPFS